MIPAERGDLNSRIFSVRERIAEVLPRLAQCVHLAVRINELTDAIGRARQSPPGGGGSGSRTPESMQEEINEIYRPFPEVKRQAIEVLLAVVDLLQRLPADATALLRIRAEIERLSPVQGEAFFSFAKSSRDLQIVDGRLVEMLAVLESRGSPVPHDQQVSNNSDCEVAELSNVGKQPNWTPIRNLGGGGQSIVDLVTREGDSTEYVRKRLKNIDSPERRSRFAQELRAYSELRHKNILRLIDFDMDPPGKHRPYVVTEYCTGGSLEDGNWPRGTIRQVLEDFLQVCDGLAHAHDRGVVHRDIKPANIFLRSDGTIAIGDFGLCLFDDAEGRVTAPEEVAGSRWYCAPELGDGRLESVRPSCDVYSLGKLLYWMLTGRVFDREKHRNDDWRLGRADLPMPIYELVNQLLDRMIAADPWARYQNALGVAESVRGVLRIESAGGHAIGLGIPQICSFCASAIYEWVADPFTNRERASTAAANFGLKMVGDPMWMILVCPSCANVQLFRPDHAPDSVKRWRRQPPNPS
jgi:hypothetical protein